MRYCTSDNSQHTRARRNASPKKSMKRRSCLVHAKYMNKTFAIQGSDGMHLNDLDVSVSTSPLYRAVSASGLLQTLPPSFSVCHGKTSVSSGLLGRSCVLVSSSSLSAITKGIWIDLLLDSLSRHSRCITSHTGTYYVDSLLSLNIILPAWF